ncbi:UNVERIFIED_CONTAM: hypothetical protein RMT77_004060 [Armadillidium vulgare]
MTEAYVTLATNDRYALGALVLAHSLRRVQTSKQLCVLITPGVSDAIRSQLIGVFNGVVCVDVMDSDDSAHLALLKRPELGVTFTKLHCWTLTQYTKCVFLDADMLAVQNSDELFEHPELSAACDVGWPDCFNSGMFVFTPSQDTYKRLLQHADNTGSFDGGDQGLLNTFFTNWNRLSFIYNMVASVTYTYLPAYKQYGSNVKFVHFLGSSKPWEQAYHVQSGTVVSQPGQEHVSSHLNTWWSIFATNVKPGLPDSVASASPTEINTPVQEYKQSEDNELNERNTYDTFSHSYETENIHTYHEHNNNNEQVMVIKNEHGNDNNIKHSHNGSQGGVEQSCTQTFIDTVVDNRALIEVETGTVSGYNVSNLQQDVVEDKSQFADNHNQTVGVVESPPHFTSSESSLNSRAFTVESECRRSSLPGAEGEQQRDSNISSHVSDVNKKHAEAIPTNFVHYVTNNKAPLSSQHPVHPVQSNSTQKSNTLSPSSLKTPLPTPLPEQPQHPEISVPEHKQTTQLGKAQLEGPSSERKPPVLWAGRSARAPLPTHLEFRFQPFISPRVPSPFSGRRPASAVTAKSPASELVDQLAGLNVSESLEESRKRWEQGTPDFRGRDSFENILAHIESKINSDN